MVSYMRRWVSLPGKLAWRWFTGAPIDGRRRDDAGWFTEGHKALPTESRPQLPDSLTAEIRGDLHAIRTEWRELRVRRALGRWFRDTESRIVSGDQEKQRSHYHALLVGSGEACGGCAGAGFMIRPCASRCRDATGQVAGWQGL